MQNKNTMVWRLKITAIIFLPSYSHVDGVRSEIFERWLGNDGGALMHEISVQFSHSVVSNSLQPHESQHTRPPCPSPSPGVHSNLCPSSQWCHPAISSSVIPFSSCPQSFPASVFSNDSTLHMTWPKYWSFSFSIIPSKEHPGLIFRMDWLDLLAVQGTLKSLLQHHNSKASRYHIHRRYLGELYCPLHHVKIQKEACDLQKHPHLTTQATWTEISSFRIVRNKFKYFSQALNIWYFVRVVQTF